MFVDQLNEFTENIQSKFDSRLTELDNKGEKYNKVQTHRIFLILSSFRYFH